jgi:hypothetical protein
MYRVPDEQLEPAGVWRGQDEELYQWNPDSILPTPQRLINSEPVRQSRLDQMQTLTPEQQTLQDQINTTTGDVPVEAVQTTQEAAPQLVQVEAQAAEAGKQAEEKALEVIKTGSAHEDRTLYDLISSAGHMLGSALDAAGEGLALTYDAWQKLSPSTKAALAGTAATAWARSKGYHNTAGDIAKGTLGLYQELSGQESNERVATTQANAKAIASGQSKGVKPTLVRQGDTAQLDTDLTTLLKDQDKYSTWYGSTDEELLAKDVAALRDQYIAEMGGDATRMKNTPIREWLKAKQGN